MRSFWGDSRGGGAPRSWPELPTPARVPAPPCRLLATTYDDDLPGDLQSLSWLTAVDVPRLQQMASGRVNLGGPSVPHVHPGRHRGGVRRGGGRVGWDWETGKGNAQCFPEPGGGRGQVSLSLQASVSASIKWD